MKNIKTIAHLNERKTYYLSAMSKLLARKLVATTMLKFTTMYVKHDRE